MVPSIAGSASTLFPSIELFGDRRIVRRIALDESPQGSTQANGVAGGASESGAAGHEESREISSQEADNESTETSANGLTDAEQAIVTELQQVDREVRAHEQAHLAAAGGLARGVSFTYVTGPDGKQYAVGGEVSIDTSPVAGNPQATIQKAQQIRAAANAPAKPSGQDRAVAAQATAMEQAARQELAGEQREAQEAQRRAQVGQQNGQTQAGAFSQPSASSQIGRFLSLIA